MAFLLSGGRQELRLIQPGCSTLTTICRLPAATDERYLKLATVPQANTQMMQRNDLHARPIPGPRESAVTIGRILLLQTLAGVVVASLALIWFGSVAGSSALIGSLICVIPNAVFALRILPGLFHSSARHSMNGFYTAEFLKIGVTVLLFVLVFSFVSPLRPDMLFVSYLLTQFSIIFAAMVTK